MPTTLHRLLATLLLSAATLPATAQPEAPPSPLKNPDFSASAPDKSPLHWSVPTPGFRASVVADEQAPPSKLAAELAPAAAQPGTPAPFGNLMQSFDAAPFRGKRLILRADVRLILPDPPTPAALNAPRAQLWLRVDRPDVQPGFFDNMGDRPIRGMRAGSYQPSTISGLIDPDAQTINIGLMALGGATARIANIRLIALDPGDEARADRPAAPLTARALDNLAAFTRLYGYTRFFHPSDAAANTDWNLFAIAAVEHVEPAKDADELAAALRDVFAPLAPTLQLWAGDAAAAPADLPKPEGATGSAAWLHNGVGLSEGADSPYTSARIRAPLDAPDDRLPAAGASLIKDLGGGVHCRLPVCLYTDAAGATLPKPAATLIPLRPERPEWWVPTGKDRSTRQANIATTWTILQHFYPYWDVDPPPGFAKTDWPAALRTHLSAAATDPDEAAFLITLQKLIALLNDGHGNAYSTVVPRPLPPAMLLAWATGPNGQPALVVTCTSDPAAATPAEGSVAVGDEIIAIAGVPLAECHAAARQRISSATEGWARHRFATDPTFMAPTTPGDSSDPVAYIIRRAGKEFPVRVPRLTDPSQTLEEPRPKDAGETTPGSGIRYFNLNSAPNELFVAALPALLKSKAIIFDLRGYPGDAAVNVLSHLADKSIRSARWNVPIITLPDLDPAGLEWNGSGRWTLKPAEPRLGAEGQKVVFLTGGGAISYAESCMGIVEHYGLAKIVGEPTAGTNGNINPLTLPGGYGVIFTGMKVLKHDRTRHHGVGILPTHPASRTVEGIAAGRDEVLEAAIKLVSEE